MVSQGDAATITPMVEAVNRLHILVDRQQRIVSDLGERLAPIMGEAQPKTTPEEKRQHTGVPMAEEMHGCMDQMDNSSNALMDFYSRLGL